MSHGIPLKSDKMQRIYFSLDIIRMIRLTRIRSVGNIARMGMRNAQNFGWKSTNVKDHFKHLGVDV
jgi:hypothetical protein